MTLPEHIVLGGGAALAVSPVLGASGSLAFWAASVLIDVDHHLDYVYRNGFRDFGARGMFAYHDHLYARIRGGAFVGLSLFHTIECFLLVAAGAFWWHSGLLFAALWGMVFHLSLDLVRLAGKRAPFSRALSVVEYWIRRRRLIRQGIDPDEPYAQALAAVPALARKGRAPARPRAAHAHPPLPPPGDLAPVPVLSAEAGGGPAPAGRPRPISPIA
ncbi:MAG: hypothetical protein AABZ70_06185 [candidate division NC10 bacterium]